MAATNNPHNPSSSSPSHKCQQSPPSTRPKPHTAATVIPTLDTPAESGSSHGLQPNQAQGQRNRSKTSALPPSIIPEVRRRARTNIQARPEAFNTHLASLHFETPSSTSLSSLSEFSRDRPSSPIPIPRRQKMKSPPITPLTARARSPIKYFGRHNGENARPYISQSLTPYYSTGTTRVVANSQPTASTPSIQRGFAAMAPRPGSPLCGYTPSPLSPTMSAQSSANMNRHKERRSPKKRIPSGLPKFHPANFPSREAGPTPLSPRSSRSITSQPRSVRGSDAQQKLQQYQRELIANAANASHSLISEGLGANPTPPRLAPLRSPVDLMTPLALEGQDDYLLAGSGSPSSRFDHGDGRDLVEQLVRRENERRRHPEARSAGTSPAISPVLSPAVSPAGGCS